MKRDTKHEGYHDSTTGAAVRQVSRKKEKLPKVQRLMYQMQEVSSFQLIQTQLQSKGVKS